MLYRHMQIDSKLYPLKPISKYSTTVLASSPVALILSTHEKKRGGGAWNPNHVRDVGPYTGLGEPRFIDQRCQIFLHIMLKKDRENWGRGYHSTSATQRVSDLVSPLIIKLITTTHTKTSSSKNGDLSVCTNNVHHFLAFPDIWVRGQLYTQLCVLNHTSCHHSESSTYIPLFISAGIIPMTRSQPLSGME